MGKSSKYGLCHRCQNPIEIPGLDGFFCSKCGWVRRPKYELSPDINKYRSPKKSTFGEMSSTPTEDSQPSLFD